ncbi:MAG: insulinase family protein [Gemmatimonadetes bacterium]|nr:insulinase family protein [Gemmatimonadota bacterium]
MSETRAIPPAPGAVRPFAVPDVTGIRLSSGAPVLVARHGRLPLVSVVIAVDGGLYRESAAQAGLASLTASALDTGAGERSGDALAWAFEQLGAELEAEATPDALLVRMTVPSARLDEALALLADVALSPAFPAAEVERLREEQLAEILLRAKEPRAHANDVYMRSLFGDAPYGRPLVGLADRVRDLDRNAVIRFHTGRFTPAQCTIVITGDIDAEHAGDALEPRFGDWQTNGAGPQPSPPAPREPPPAIHLVDRADAVQSEIRVGHIGVDRKHRDYYPLRVMNTILGGAFTSRLNLNLRERNGFTYGVRSGFGFRRARGPFLIETGVATEVTARAIEEILTEVNALRDNGATGEEVANARDYLAGVMPLELETTAQLAVRLADLATYDLPLDELGRYRASIEAVTVDDVARVAREHVRPDRFVMIVVGNADSVRHDLAGLGVGPVHDVAD